MDTGPATMLTVVPHALPPVPEAGQVLPGAAEVTVLARIVSPLSGLSTVTE